MLFTPGICTGRPRSPHSRASLQELRGRASAAPRSLLLRAALSCLALPMSRRQRSAPKANVSSSVRLGLESICEGNESALRSMLDANDADDLVEKLIDCMGVSNLNAEMLLANFFNAGILSTYAKRLGKSDKGSTATLAERIAREWAKPSFAPPAGSSKRKADEPPEEDAASKRTAALEDMKAKRAKQQAAKQAATSETTGSASPPRIASPVAESTEP